MTGARPGRPRQFRKPTQDELVELRSVAARVRFYRVEIVLAASEGMTNRDIAARFRKRPATVGALLQRFSKSGIAGLNDRSRTGRRSTVSPAQTQGVLDLHRAGGRTQEQIAKLVGISRYQVFHILREYRRRHSRPGREPNS